MIPPQGAYSLPTNSPEPVATPINYFTQDLLTDQTVQIDLSSFNSVTEVFESSIVPAEVVNGGLTINRTINKPVLEVPETGDVSILAWSYA